MEQKLRDALYECESKHWWWRSRWKIIGRAVRLVKNGETSLSILDAGCSTGALWSYLSPKHSILGCDEDVKALNHLKHPNNRKTAVCDLKHLPAKPESMDIVLALDMLEHLPEEGPVLRSIYKALKPGGYLIATVPAHKWLWSKWDEYNHHFRRYNANQFRTVIRNAGFEVTYVSYFNAFLFIPFVLFHLWSRIFPRPIDPIHQAKIPKANPILEFIFSFEQHFLGKSFSFPIGTSVLAIARKA